MCPFLPLAVSLAIVLDVQSRYTCIPPWLYRNNPVCANLWYKIHCYLNNITVGENEYWALLKEGFSLHRFWDAVVAVRRLLKPAASQTLGFHMEQWNWQSCEYLWHYAKVKSGLRSKFCRQATCLLKIWINNAALIFTFFFQTELCYIKS